MLKTSGCWGGENSVLVPNSFYGCPTVPPGADGWILDQVACGQSSCNCMQNPVYHSFPTCTGSVGDCRQSGLQATSDGWTLHFVGDRCQHPHRCQDINVQNSGNLSKNYQHFSLQTTYYILMSIRMTCHTIGNMRTLMY